MTTTFIFAAHVNRTNLVSVDGDGALVCFSRTNGAYQWNVTWGSTSYDDALGFTMSADSMLYMVGHTGSYGNGAQVYLNKYSRYLYITGETKSFTGQSSDSTDQALLLKINGRTMQTPDTAMLGIISYSHNEQNAKLEIYPNPFIRKTVIKFTVNSSHFTDKNCRLQIYDLTGRSVKTLFDSQLSTLNSQLSVVWDGRDNSKKFLPSGIYFIELKVSDKFSQTKKLLLLR